MADVTNYTAFLRYAVGVPVAALADDSPVLRWSFDYGLNMCLSQLATVPNAAGGAFTIYDQAVYNLAADWLVRAAQDTPPATYWTALRAALNLNTFQAGWVSSASDSGTSTGLNVPRQLQDATISDLMLAQTPWGRTYLSLAGSWGTVWGLSS